MGREHGPYFAVARGKQVGIYNSWRECQDNVLGIAYSKFKRFNDRKEAQRFITGLTGPRPRQFKTFYAVAVGKKVGIFRSWNETRDYVLGVPSSKFKKFDNKREAIAYIRENRVSPFQNAFLKPAERQPENAEIPSNSMKVEPIEYVKSEWDGAVKQESDSSASSTPKESVFRKVSQMYVDGAARRNGMGGTVKAGFGIYIGPGDPRNIAVPLSLVDDVNINQPTNLRAELFALMHGLRIAYEAAQYKHEKFDIYTDSMYAKNCVELWSKTWVRNGWRSAQGQPVANQDIIKRALDLYNKINEIYERNNLFHIQIIHVRGHQGNEGNEKADGLANEGADMM